MKRRVDSRKGETPDETPMTLGGGGWGVVVGGRERRPHGDKRSKRKTPWRRPLAFRLSEAKVIDATHGRSVPVNIDEMQKKLSEKATKELEHRFEDLYSLLCNPIWLQAAHQSVNTNQGRETAGIDAQTVAQFNRDVEGKLTRLRETLVAKNFEPMPVRRVYIPTPNSDKKRPLGIPTLLDRIVQEALRMILEPIWEADFSTHSYGFRPNLSTYDAISYLSGRLTGYGAPYQWVIEGDITSYFDPAC